MENMIVGIQTGFRSVTKFVTSNHIKLKNKNYNHADATKLRPIPKRPITKNDSMHAKKFRIFKTVKLQVCQQAQTVKLKNFQKIFF